VRTAVGGDFARSFFNATSRAIGVSDARAMSRPWLGGGAPRGGPALQLAPGARGQLSPRGDASVWVLEGGAWAPAGRVAGGARATAVQCCGGVVAHVGAGGEAGVGVTFVDAGGASGAGAGGRGGARGGGALAARFTLDAPLGGDVHAGDVVLRVAAVGAELALAGAASDAIMRLGEVIVSAGGTEALRFEGGAGGASAAEAHAAGAPWPGSPLAGVAWTGRARVALRSGVRVRVTRAAGAALAEAARVRGGGETGETGAGEGGKPRAGHLAALAVSPFALHLEWDSAGEPRGTAAFEAAVARMPSRGAVVVHLPTMTVSDVVGEVGGRAWAEDVWRKGATAGAAARAVVEAARWPGDAAGVVWAGMRWAVG
jgi:hypothetical protein